MAGKGASVAHLFGEPLEQRPRSVRLRQRRHRDAALDSRAALCSRSVLGASASGPSQAVAVGSGIRRRCASALLQPALGAALQRIEVLCGLVPVARERARAEELPELLQRDAPARLRDTQPPWAAVRRPARGVQIFALRPQAEGLVLRAAQEAVAVSVEQLEDRADRVGRALSGPSGRGGRALQPPVRVHSVHVARLPMPRGGGPRAPYTTARTAHTMRAPGVEVRCCAAEAAERSVGRLPWGQPRQQGASEQLYKAIQPATASRRSIVWIYRF